MLVQQILGNKDAGVLTVAPGTPLSQVAALLTERRIGGVVVSSDGQTAEGIISERDIVRLLAARGGGCLNDDVADAMTKRVETCGKDDTADSVLQRMTDGRFRHMPVVENGKMIGIVTIGDLVKARLSELAMEKDALEGMIMGH
jgi:CBS domain-containing protein